MGKIVKFNSLDGDNVGLFVYSDHIGYMQLNKFSGHTEIHMKDGSVAMTTESVLNAVSHWYAATLPSNKDS